MAELQDSSSNTEKLVSVTRQDLSGGYQTAQIKHAALRFAYHFPDLFREWIETSDSVICLAARSSEELSKLMETLDKKGLKYVKFFEPDVNETTAITIQPSETTRRLTSHLPLANKVYGTLDKNHLTKEKVMRDMATTFQFQEQSVLQHGESVYKYYRRLVECLDRGTVDADLRIPDTFFTHWASIKENLYDEETMKEYMILHDCGKPYCRMMDAFGKQHFPDHANKSAEVYMQVWGNQTVGELIRGDMDIHMLKDAGVDGFLSRPAQQICTHLMVGLAELLSNATMFGGVESDGFKMKFKQLTQRSKKILPQLFALKQAA